MSGTGPTKKSDLVIPEVLADMLSAEVNKAMRFLPLAQVDSTLVGQPGDTITFPAYTYIGDAKDVAEGEDIPLDKIGKETKQVKVKKAGKGTSITDEARLSGYGNPLNESIKQLAISIAQKKDNDLLDAAKAVSTLTENINPTVEGIHKALDKFEDEDDSTVVCIMSPKNAAALRSDAIKAKVGSDVGANQLIKGTYLDVLGVQIIRSKKMDEGTALFIKVNESRPALKLVEKQGAEVETDRNIVNKTTIITATEHYAPYVFDESKIVKATVSPVI